MNLYFDTIDIKNVFPEEDSNLTNFLDSIDVKYHCKKTDKIDTNFSDSFYVIEPMYMPTGTIFSNIPKNIKNKLRNRKIKLVLYFPIEGYPFDWCNWMKNLHQSLEENNLKDSYKILIYGNIKTKEMYDNFCKANNTPTRFDKVIGINYFEKSFYNDYRSNIVSDVNKTKIQSKDFLNFNGTFKHNRLILVSELKRRNLEKYGYVSYVGRHMDDNVINECVEICLRQNLTTKQTSFLLQYAKNWQPQYIDISLEELQSNDRQSNRDLYDNTKFSLISETLTSGGIFITEKTFKAVLHKHPFIIYGNKGTLRYLKDIGYKTFPELFDESYDDVENEMDRLNCVLDTVENFCNMPKDKKIKLIEKVQWKINHNKKLFLDQTSKGVSNIKNVFKEL